jgi:hypothetical protein
MDHFCTSSSRVLLNGIPRDPIKHVHGLRQGDPLPPCFSTLPSTLSNTSLKWPLIMVALAAFLVEVLGFAPPTMLTMRPFSWCPLMRTSPTLHKL